MLSKYLESKDIDIKKADGNLLQTLTYKDILIENLEFLPKDSILRIKKIDISLMPLNISRLTVKIHNGMLMMPNFDAILFYGSFQEGGFDMNVYSKNVGVREVLGLFARNSDIEKISGTISGLDAYIKGTFLEPELTGTFAIDKLTRDGFSITSSPCSFNLHLKDTKDELKLFGSISLNSGVISGPKTTLINMQESKIIFNGIPQKPSLDFKGTSTIEGIKINIVLKGTMDTPDLKLTSVPSLPQEQLLVMLVTGKSWKAAQVSLSKGQISPELAKDFIEYYIFSGLGDKIAQQFGLTNLTLKYDNQSKGIGVEKTITDKVKAIYIIEQPQVKGEQPAAVQKVGGEYKITESISIEAEKEIKQNNKSDETQQKSNSDDKAFLKYKKDF